MTQTKPVTPGDVLLSDGMLLSNLIDHDRHEVSMRVLTDPEIYRLEQDRIFGRTWIPVAHESEVPNEGDFVVRKMGEDPVIVSRLPDGEITVLLNVCSHRGMQICRADFGNSPRFRCPYHAWVFAQDGSFLGAPFEKEMYEDTLDKSTLGLERARVELFGGMVFANWNHEAPDLTDFFGGMKWYLEMILCRSATGMEVLGPPQQTLVPSNWKAPAEQGNGDAYHSLSLHRAFIEMFQNQRPRTAAEAGLLSIDITAGGGGLRCLPTAPRFRQDIADRAPFSLTVEEADSLLAEKTPVGMTPEMAASLHDRLSADQRRVLASYYPSVGQAFPAFEFLHFNTPALSAGGMAVEGGEQVTRWSGATAPITVLHTWVPRGVEAFEFSTWILAERDATAEQKRQALKASVQTLGTSGTIEMDDGDAWPSQTAAARGFKGSQQTFKYRGFRHHTPPSGWPGPGVVHSGVSGDDSQWSWWERYFRFMLGEE